MWRDTKIAKSQLELYLGSGVTIGKSAAKLSQDVRQCLKNPNSLFRRVRDRDGNLVLSKAAKKYHPGRGIYRSAYKNAMRLTRTENNMAYKASDYLRRKQLPFVQGITVKLSNAHPQYDICNPLAGDYPKGFNFMGWHSQCICYTVSKLPTKEEFVNYIKTGQMDHRKFTRAIPTKAQNYLEKHKKQIQGWKNKPYWAENFTKDYKLKKSIIRESRETVNA